ncbi:MAG: multicopper oxidase family protein [Beijerinckiaceae bacterium]
MTLDRRTFLAGSAALLLPDFAYAEGDARGDGFRLIQPKPLETPLPGRLAYGEDEAPPILRIVKGDELRVRLVNGLDLETSIHWRGLRGPNAMDGTPLVQRPVKPGESFDYRFTPPDAGTYIFQPHAETTFAAQAQRGLGGVLVVEEPAGQAVDHDLVAALSDRPAAADEFGPCAHGPRVVVMHTSRQIAGEGLMGSVVTVNGRPAPGTHAFAPRARVRLRLANLATSRLMAIGFEGVQPVVVAVDGQNCPAFEPLRNTLPLAPGGRFDVIFDMPEQEDATARIALLGAKAEGAWDGTLLAFRAAGWAIEARPPVADPEPNPALPENIALQRAFRADLAFDAKPQGESAAMCPGRAPLVWQINGKYGLDNMKLFSVKRGTPVSLGLANRSGAHIVVRLHGHFMRQLHSMDDGWDPYWRDAVVVPAGRTVRVAFVADNPGRWRIGGGILPQALGGQAGYFEVA